MRPRASSSPSSAASSSPSSPSSSPSRRRAASTAPRRVRAAPPPGAVLLLLLLFAVLPAPRVAEAASFVVEKANLQIIEPDSIKGSFDSAIGDFGVPNYGAKIIGEVTYDASNALGCGAFSNVSRATGVGHSTVVLVDRGECFFVEKAWRAQQAGANAVIVADDVDEGLVTMAQPDAADDGASSEIAELAERVTIPSALVTKSVGDALRDAIVAKNQVPLVALDWSDSIASPDARVEWELWHSTNQVCGRVCARVEAFINEMATPAAKLEKSGAASFSPHFITWACRKDSVEESDCDRLCINKGRYCAPDPISGVDVDAATVAAVRKHGYNGTHVARENLRQLCLHKELNRNVTLNGEGTTTNASSPPSPAPWLWWTYATRHNAECKMTAGQFNRECSARVMAGHGLSEAFVDRVEKCVGDVDADADNPTMELELRLQDDLDDSGRGAIVLMPTVVINLDQYRGRLTGADALRAICAGYRETTEPAVCLARGMETNECEAPGNAGCWHYADPASGKNFSACRDTFRGYECVCPPGFKGDGATCEDVDECDDPSLNDCEQTCANEVGGHACACDAGYKLVGGFSCVLIDECLESGDNGGCDQRCVARPGGHSCACIEGYALQKDGRKCKLPGGGVRGGGGGGVGGGTIFFAMALVLLVVGGAGYGAYQWKLQSHIDGEVRAIMKDYLPLEDHDRGASGGGGGGGGGGASGSPPEARPRWIRGGGRRREEEEEEGWKDEEAVGRAILPMTRDGNDDGGKAGIGPEARF